MPHRHAAARTAPFLGLLTLLLAIPTVRPRGARAEEPATPSLTVLGARIQPLNDKGKPWDADHGAIPRFVYILLGEVSGFPPVAALAVIPYRNRPDPYVVVRRGGDEGEEIARSSVVQGAFLPQWRLHVPLDEGVRSSPTLVFEAYDDDLRDDDVLGKVVVETEKLLAKPGVQVLEGTRGLYDLTVVVHRPDLAAEGPPKRVTLDSLALEVREKRPTGGDWDAGGNPLRGRLPKRLPLPEDLEGLPEMRPDLVLHVASTDGVEKTSKVYADAFACTWEDVHLGFGGRPGVGDGLFVDVVDRDLALSDPVGVVFVPYEDLLAKAGSGTLEVEGDEKSGIAKLVLHFRVE